MNIRERALAILRGQQPDYVPWYGDLYYWIDYLRESGKLPEKYKGEGVIQLHKDLGVGFYLQGYFPWKAHHNNIDIKNDCRDGICETTVETPAGTMKSVSKYLPGSYTWGIQEHYVKGVEDLKVIRYWYENTVYEPDYELAIRRRETVNGHGLVLTYLPRSPLMQMVTELAGIEATTYAMLDDEDEFEETIQVLRKKADEAAKIALESPVECLMIPENLSSEVVGKNLFNKYMRPYEEEWNKSIEI